MLLRNLRLPDGNVMLYTGEVVGPEHAHQTDLTWDDLSGQPLDQVRETQPFVGCVTGGDKVAEHLMARLKEH